MMSQDEIMQELGTNSKLNRARQAFRHHCAKIEQASQQRTPLYPVEHRRMEFEAVLKIKNIFDSES